MSDKKRNWVENNPIGDEDVWDKEDEPVLEGKLVKIEHDIGPNKSEMYTIKKDNDTDIKVWGSTVLNDRFMGVPVGTYVRVNYEGLKKGKNGKEYNNYKVFIDEDSVPDTQAQDDVDRVFSEEEMPTDFLK